MDNAPEGTTTHDVAAPTDEEAGIVRDASGRSVSPDEERKLTDDEAFAARGHQIIDENMAVAQRLAHDYPQIAALLPIIAQTLRSLFTHVVKGPTEEDKVVVEPPVEQPTIAPIATLPPNPAPDAPAAPVAESVGPAPVERNALPDAPVEPAPVEPAPEPVAVSPFETPAPVGK